MHSYNRVSDLKVKSKDILTLSIKKELEVSDKFNGIVEAYVNRIILTDKFSSDDVVDIFLVSEDYKTYIYNYKDKGKVEKNSIRVSQDSGRYAIYVKVNDVMYDTGKVINFN